MERMELIESMKRELREELREAEKEKKKISLRKQIDKIERKMQLVSKASVASSFPVFDSADESETME
jgi:hypothetical protein